MAKYVSAFLFGLQVGFLACSPNAGDHKPPSQPSVRVEAGRQPAVEERSIQLATGVLWFRQCGRGPAVLLLHGWRGNADQWRHQLAPLAAAGFRAVAPDLPGTRNSPLNDAGVDPRNPELHVAVLTRLLDYLNVATAHVVGHSWGGIVAQRFALNHPDRIASLVLVDSAVEAGRVDEMEKIRCPTLIVWAEDDKVSPVELGRSLARLISTSELVVMKGVGADIDPAKDPYASHIPPLYSPEEFNRHLIRFLASKR